MALSRKRQKELNKLKRSAEELWDEQRDALEHASAVLKDARRQAANYAREELVAELGAAFLCADLELSMQPREDHAEYIAIWLKILRNDKRAIFQASSMAQKAVDFLHGLQCSQLAEKPRRTAA